MDEQLQRKLLRQLKLSNFFMGVVLMFVLVTFAVLAFLAWTVVTFTNDVRTRVDEIQTKTEETLDVRSDICNEQSLRRLIGDSSFCKTE